MMDLSNSIIVEFIKSFESIFSELLISGYYSMIGEKRYNLEMEEEELSAELIKHIKRQPFKNEHLITVLPETRIYGEDVYKHKIKPKQAPRPDIILVKWISWQINKEIEYYIEAKNLSESTWKKKNYKNPVNAKKQKEDYIKNGIDRFVTEKYPYGCLTGYVVQGNPDKIISDINDILLNFYPSRKSEILKEKFKVLNYPHCYQSYHFTESNNLCLKHFLLKL